MLRTIIPRGRRARRRRVWTAVVAAVALVVSGLVTVSPWSAPAIADTVAGGPMPPGTLPGSGGGTYALVAAHSGKCADVSGQSSAEGARVWQWACHDGDNQAWRFQPAGDGTLTFTSVLSDKCLEVAGRLTADRAAVQQWSCHGGDNQRWRPTYLDDGSFTLAAAHSDKCLEVADVSAADAAPLQQWPCHSGGQQRWRFAKVYTLTVAHSDKCLDVSGGSAATGARVWQWTCRLGDNQRWRVASAGAGTYTLAAVHSGQCLDVDSTASAVDGAKVQQWPCHRADNQRWRLQPSLDGTYSLVAMHSNKCLDVDSVAGAADGGKAQQWPCNGAANQQWKLPGFGSAKDCGLSWPQGKVFTAGEAHANCLGHTLAFDAGGNLVVFDEKHDVAWSSGTHAPGGRMEFQPDGKLAIRNAANQTVWDSGTTASSPRLDLDERGNFGVYNTADSMNAPVWGVWQVQADKEVEELRRQVQELRREFEKAQAKDAIEEARYQEALGKIAQLEQALGAVRAQADADAKEPCARHAVGKAVAELVAAVLGVIAIWKTKGKVDWKIITGVLAAVVASAVDWYEIVRKCVPWAEIFRLLQENPINPAIMTYLAPGPTGPELAFGNFGYAGLPDGTTAVVVGDFVADSEDGFKQSVWEVDYSKDPRTPANTVAGTPAEITRDGVPGTLYKMANGDEIFMARGPADFSVLYERDNSTGHSVQTIYDANGNYVVTVDSDRGVVNTDDGWNGNNQFNAANGSPYGWGLTGFGGWTNVGGGGSGGGSDCHDSLIQCFYPGPS